MTSTSASPATAQAKASATDTHRFALNANDDSAYISLAPSALKSLSDIFIVPIFDGRRKKIDLPSGLRTVPRDLPPFMGDIPFDSLAVVAYSAMSYKSSRHPDDVSVAFNAVWVVVLGTPKEEYVSMHAIHQTTEQYSS